MVTLWRITALVAVAAIFLVLMANGSAQAQEPATVDVSDSAQFGGILTDGSGNTLYLFTRDERNVSNCSGGCAGAWPPLATTGDPVAGDGLVAGLGTLERADGSTQVTINGWPLYKFASDAAPGQTNGQGVGGSWFVVSVYGGPVQTGAEVQASDHDGLGTILIEASGRTLYLFTPDERNVSNCAGGCAAAWPPLVTVGDPVAGDGVSANHLGAIDRGDGYSQVTYNGWPLYYFAFDGKPGDANGQNSRDVWFVLSTDGGPISNNATVKTTDHPVLGPILTDAGGRTLYLFTPDERGNSACTGGCALAWPPVVTVDDPVAGEGTGAALLGTIARDGGYTQVTYNSWPLYYFAFDSQPGDANGQGSRGVWFTLTSAGAARGLAVQAPATGEATIPLVAQLGLATSSCFCPPGRC